ncbi:MAG: phosphoribosylglycinamide formyltransferase 1 [Clostridiales bacterium]|jgi:phosphoribosylglycinamide formyltransferase-1|nr:phosphoribosylglycinamide formyltransferase 1 [Clostridiales bacterium]MDN5298624.1 phosphoribosylglycinamide formyltransferase 1 [Clostridiales bacterium]
MQVKKLAVLISGGGSNLQALIDAIESGEISAKIEMVISNREKAYGLTRAEQNNIPTYYLGIKNYPDSDERAQALNALLASHHIDYVVLAGYLSILKSETIRQYEGRIVNIHPSLIPKYCGEGFYGHHVHEAVLANGESESGATTHFVDEGVDTGKIIYQERVPVLADDTAETLSERVLTVEHQLIVQTVRDLCSGSI